VYFSLWPTGINNLSLKLEAVDVVDGEYLNIWP